MLGQGERMPATALTLRYAATSDRGLVRQNNEDSLYAGPHLIAVADGVGGAAGGEVASAAAIEAIAPLDQATTDDASALVGALRGAVDDAADRIRTATEDDPELDGMGTTLTAIMLAGGRLGLLHLGDSRAYRLRDGELTQLTRDDTYVQMLVEQGAISAEEADHHPQRSIVTRVLQGKPVDPTCLVIEPRLGDRYLVSSDGLNAVLDAEAIEEILRDEPDVHDCANALVQRALAGGGPDNVTVIVADLVVDTTHDSSDGEGDETERRLFPAMLLVALLVTVAAAAIVWLRSRLGPTFAAAHSR